MAESRGIPDNSGERIHESSGNNDAVAAKALELLSHESSAGLSAQKKSGSPPEKALSPGQDKGYLETCINAGTSTVISNDETRNTVNRLAVDFIKSASLFTGGKLGLASTVIAYGLDQAHPHDSLKEQAADFVLGGARGATMRGMFSVIGASGAIAPLKGALMGLGAGAVDETFKRETFTDPSSLNERLRQNAFNPQAILLNAAVFSAGEGLYAGLNLASKGALAENRLISGMVMGGSFGFVNGTVAEAAREMHDQGSLSAGKVLFHGLLDGGVSAAGAGVGLKVSDPVFQAKVKDGAAKALDSMGLNRYLPSSAAYLDYAIHTTIVGEDGAQRGWLKLKGDRIVGIAPETEHPVAKHTIEFDGYAYPGLIDTHNHVDWNTIERWSAGHDFANRYEWMKDAEYLKEVQGRKDLQKSCKVEATVYGEIRALTGGTTMIQSRFDKSAPSDVVIRQIDPKYKADSYTGNVSKMPAEVHDELLGGLNSKRLNRVFFHVAEGQHQDAETSSEFGELRKAGFVHEGTVVIHGVGLKPADFEEMKANGMYLAWSPESNLNLYSQTTDIRAAKQAGLTISLAPDWTITGSNNTLEELHVATNFAEKHGLQDILTPKTLFKMVTSDAAEVAGVGQQLGRLAPNYGADVVLLQKHNADPYTNLVQANTSDVSLVFIKGKPLYGEPGMMKPLAPRAEAITVAGQPMSINPDGIALQTPVSKIIEKIHSVLPDLAPLHEK